MQERNDERSEGEGRLAPGGARVVLGLGNPGRRYEKTRHNVGFRAVDALAHRLGTRFRANLLEDVADIALADVGGEEIVIAKPLTWMNRSGLAAARIAARYGTEPSRVLVTYDDIALPLGAIRVRAAGRSAGQKGMESIIQELGTTRIPRVRIGILGDREGSELADYVLEPFRPSEREIAETMIDEAAGALLTVIERGVGHAMNVYNGRVPGPA